MKYVNLCKTRKAGSITSLGGSSSKTARSRGVFGFIPVLVILAVLGGAFFIFKNKIKASFNPVEIISNVATTKLKETDGRTNILIMGSDQRDSGAESGRSVLTDTLLVASVGKMDNDVVFISIPRDLWVESQNGYYSKINAVYATAENNTKGTGAQELSKTLQNVLGIPIHYYVLVNFDIFEDVINTLGGITVNVDNAFTDYSYPIEGNENATCGKTQEQVDEELLTMSPEYVVPCRFKTYKFEAGTQKMDAETALAFARSRHGNNNEGTDFARAKRQQKIIMAVKDKALSVETLTNPAKLKDLYDAYSRNVDTNIDLATVQAFYALSQQVDLHNMTSVVLDDRGDAESGGLLYAPEDNTLYGGQYVLLPKSGDYSQVHAYVQKYLFGAK